MLKHRFLAVICMMLITGGAYGAASLRAGATTRAGSLRTLGGGTAASVKVGSSAGQVSSSAVSKETGANQNSRMAYLSGAGASKTSGKIDLPSAASSQAIAELRQAIKALREDYDALGNQYNNLSDDISNVSDTAYTARVAATNNANVLTAVRSDLSVAKAEIEDIKTNGVFDETLVQQTVEDTLATKGYATQADLAATDVVARGAVQVSELGQKLSALNVADKDYVDAAVGEGIDESRVQEIVSDNMANYYTKGEINGALEGFVDGEYVSNKIDAEMVNRLGGYATKGYVDTAVATGMDEEQVNGIVTNVINDRMQNYYNKGEINEAIEDFVGSDYVDNRIDAKMSTGLAPYATREYVDGLDVGLSDSQVRSIVAEALVGLVDESLLRNEIKAQLNGYATEEYVDDRLGDIDIDLDEDRVREIVLGYDYRSYDQIQQMIANAAPNVQIKYENGAIYYMNSQGQWVEIDIEGLNGQDADQIEMANNSGVIQWRYKTGDDQTWKTLVNVSDLKGDQGIQGVKGDPGDPVELKVAKAVESGHSGEWLQYRVDDGTDPWHDIYDMANLHGTSGCGVAVSSTDWYENGVVVGKTLTFTKDCNGGVGDGDVLTTVNIRNGSGGTVTVGDIQAALNDYSDYIELRNTVSGHTTSIGNINTTLGDSNSGLAAAHTKAGNAQTTATNAWDRVKDLGKDASNNDYTTVLSKIGDVGTKTVKDYVDTAVSSVAPNIQIARDSVTNLYYFCKKTSCDTTNPDFTDETTWVQFDLSLSDYLLSANLANKLGDAGEVAAIKSAVASDLSAKLNKTGIQLTRDGSEIKISGGGIATAYKVADVTDLMCEYYRIEEKSSGASGTTYELICGKSVNDGEH